MMSEAGLADDAKIDFEMVRNLPFDRITVTTV
jgi:hypothetical protein